MVILVAATSADSAGVPVTPQSCPPGTRPSGVARKYIHAEEEIRGPKTTHKSQYQAAKRRDTTVSRTVQWPQKTSAFARRAYTSMEAEPSVSAEAGNRPFAQIGTSYVQSCVANAIDPPPGGRAAFARD